MTANAANSDRRTELEELRARLSEAEETLRAIRRGETDALMIAGPAGDEVHLLGSGDHICRQFIETIREGTATVSAAGVILSCSSSLAQTLRRPLEQLLGSAMRDHLSPDDHEAFAAVLTETRPESHRRKLRLKTSEGSLVPVYLSATLLYSGGAEPVCCLVFTDLEEVVSAEEELRESEIRLRQAQITAGLGSYLLDIPAGRWRSSDELDKLLGIDEAYERTTQGWQTLVHPDDRAGIVDFLTNALPGPEQPFDMDFRIIRHDDHAERWMHGLGRLTGDAHGHPLAMYGTIQDVTGRKEAEARILKLTQLYAALSKSNEAVVRSPNQEVLFATTCHVAVKLGGMEMAWIGLVEDAAGQRVLPVASCGAGEEHLNAMRITTDAGDPFGRGPTGTAIRENRAFWSQDYLQDPTTTPWHESGERFGWAASAALPLTRNGTPVGNLTLYAGTVAAFDEETRRLLTEMAGNISFALDKFAAEGERQSAVQELRSSHLLYQKTLSSLDEAVLVVDVKTRLVLDCNQTTESIFGYSREELVGRDTRRLHVDDETFAAFAAEMLAQLAKKGFAKFEFRMRRKNGDVFPTEHFLRPLQKDDGSRFGVVSVIRDITGNQRLATEKAGLEDQLRQAQKIEAVGRLAGGVAHDFNNLTAIVLGYGEMLLGRLPPDEPARKWAEQIVAAGKRSATLTRQLLAFSRRQVLLPVVLDLNELLRNLEQMFGRIIGEDIDLRFDLAEGLGCVTVDPGQIEQVVTNLVINARDAMPHGGKLTIETADVDLDETFAAEHRGVVPGEYVRLDLTDTGCGMDKATLARMFEPFFTTKDKGKGTGLGLATSFGIVKQSGGYIYVASKPDQGTTFTIYLPRTAAKPKAEEAGARGAVPQGAGERILLVEDEASLLELCAITLTRCGYRVSTAAGGPEALALVEEQGCEPDLVVTDVIMPGMSGTELTRRLRRGRPGLKVLYMSGYPDETIAPHGVLGPGVSFLAKPFLESVLAAKVSDALGSRTPAAARRRRRVLMIDDDAQYRELVRHFCAKRGHDCAGVATAAAALAALGGQPCDVLLVDLNIPGTSGERILREIRAAGHTTPAIVLTGDVASAEMEVLRPLGAVQALEKSSDPGPLLQAIEKASDAR